MDLPSELVRLEEQLDAADRDAGALVAGLTAERACWRLRPDSWNVAFSLATGLHAIAAHDRRHLWQAWQVRRLAEVALGASDL